MTFEIETGFPDTVRMAPGEGPDAVLMRGGSALVSPLGKVLAGPVTPTCPSDNHRSRTSMLLLIKLLHIVAVIAFLGNIATGLFWHAHAARTRDPRLLAHAMDGIIRSDRLFTVPAVIGIIATGVAAAIYGGHPILRTGWILWTLILFLASGLVFMIRVAPLQRQLLALAEAATRPGTFDYAGYHAHAVRWEAWGAAALLTPAAGLALMVLKPTL